MNTDITPDFNPRLGRAFFLVLLGVITCGFLGMISAFLPIVFWAAVLAIVFEGMHRQLLRHWPGRRNRAALLTVLIVLGIVVIPVAVVSLVLVEETVMIYEKIKSREFHPERVVAALGERLPALEHQIAKFGVSVQQQTDALGKLAGHLVEATGKIALKSTQGIGRMFVEFTLMLYILFFFVRDGAGIVAGVKRCLPIGDEVEERLFARFAAVSRATLKGAVLVAVAQGAVGGIALAILGVPGATLWGLVMVVLSFLPAVGAGLVWVPAALVLLIHGHYGKGIALLLIGVFVISMIDNFLRPLLMRGATGMPDYLILIATLGGITAFGLSGLLIGPVIAAMFLTCWEVTGQVFDGRRGDCRQTG
jgi:predicted PurR-regulated permease PerM